MDEKVHKNITERVMDGAPTLKPLPYQLRLIRQDGIRCGAVIVSPRYAVTAYHCIEKKDGTGKVPNKFVTVYAGAYNVEKLHLDKNVQKRGVRRIVEINFKNGSRFDIVPDLAVLLLDEPLQMNEFVTPACLPTKEVPINEECIVSGWGRTVSYLPPPATLRAATVFTSKLQHCSHMVDMDDGTKIPVGDYDLCTYHPTKSACRGDSGGPLVCNIHGGATLYGVVSRGGYCNPHVPNVKYGLYTNVYYFKDEIEALIGTDNPCPTNENYYADEFCDGNLNNSENCFDGGDCCGAEANYEYCNSYNQECKCRA